MTLTTTLSTQLFAVVLFSFTFTACKKKPPFEVNTNAYIIGSQNDILKFGDSPQKKTYETILKSSVLIATKLDSGKTKFCSGILMRLESDKTDRILTNHHCFAITGENDKATETLLKEACVQTTLYFGFSTFNNPDPFTTTCLPGSLKTDFIGDIATFNLTKDPPANYMRLKLAKNPAPVNTAAFILHYPDIKEHMALPPNSPIQLPEAAITMSNCKILGPFPKEEWVLDRTLPHGIRHTCDLIHGSSGSALLNANNFEIIGINWGGIKVSYTDKNRTDNVATSAEYILAYLTGNVEKLQLETKKEINNQNQQASADAEAKTKGKNVTASDIVKKKVSSRCGVIGTNSKGLFFVLMLLPIFICWYRRRSYA